MLDTNNDGTLLTYYYLKNAHGDITAIVDENGAVILTCTYDAWGNVISVKDANGNDISNTNSIAHRNPIRYRGYYYDSDLGLYYLQSRYYDSTICRFINGDSQLTINIGLYGLNLFAYCDNNPLNRSDSSGHNWWSDFKKSVSNVWNNITNLVSSAINKTEDCLSNKTENYTVNNPKHNGAIVGVTILYNETHEFVKDRFSTPEKTSNTLKTIAITLDFIAGYLGCIAVGLSIPTFGVSAPTAGTAAAILGLVSASLQVVAHIIDIYNEEDEEGTS